MKEAAYLDFQHPEYLTHFQRYRDEFDYYNLDLVLLEIELWEPLSAITKDLSAVNKDRESLSPEILRETLLTDVLPECAAR